MCLLKLSLSFWKYFSKQKIHCRFLVLAVWEKKSIRCFFLVLKFFYALRTAYHTRLVFVFIQKRNIIMLNAEMKWIHFMNIIRYQKKNKGEKFLKKEKWYVYSVSLVLLQTVDLNRMLMRQILQQSYSVALAWLFPFRVLFCERRSLRCFHLAKARQLPHSSSARDCSFSFTIVIYGKHGFNFCNFTPSLFFGHHFGSNKRSLIIVDQFSVYHIELASCQLVESPFFSLIFSPLCYCVCHMRLTRSYGHQFVKQIFAS